IARLRAHGTARDPRAEDERQPDAHRDAMEPGMQHVAHHDDDRCANSVDGVKRRPPPAHTHGRRRDPYPRRPLVELVACRRSAGDWSRNQPPRRSVCGGGGGGGGVRTGGGGGGGAASSWQIAFDRAHPTKAPNAAPPAVAPAIWPLFSSPLSTLSPEASPPAVAPSSAPVPVQRPTHSPWFSAVVAHPESIASKAA